MKTQICASGENLYVVYPEAITSYEFEVAELLATRIAALTQVSPVLVHGAGLPQNAPAVLVGNTGCAETLLAAKDIAYGEGILRIFGNRVVLAALTDDVLPQLASILLAELPSAGNGTDGLCISTGLDGKKVWDGSYLNRLPLCTRGSLVAYRKSHDDCKMLVFGNTVSEDFDSYFVTLQLAGFTVCEQRDICQNRFAILTDGVALVHLYYTPFNQYLRVIAEPRGNAPLPVPDDRVLCQPVLFVSGRRFSTTARYLGVDSGAGNMSYVFRLSNGEFLIVDGGMKTDSYTDAIMELLEQNAPDPAHITIAAWIITHAHIDHLGAFLHFSEKYANRVKLTQLITNYPSMQDAEAYREAWDIRRTKQSIYRYWKGTHYAKVHTGDVLTLADARVEFLYTQEDIVRQYLALPNFDFNYSSLALRVHIAGETVMLMGDVEDSANDNICAMYGDYLKSDLLQVCHHGGRGGTKALYALIDPEVAFFCTTDELFPKYLSLDYNHALVYEQSLKEVYNASEVTFSFPLPYHAEGTNIPPFTGDRTYKRAKYLESLASIGEL